MDMRGKQEDKKMLMIVIAALVLGTLLFRRNALPEGTDEMIGQGHKSVKASVDGKPVHSYCIRGQKQRVNCAGQLSMAASESEACLSFSGSEWP